MALPRLMVAPNGARWKKADHPALPVTISETVEVARACFEAGADGLHAHVRDADEEHCLDAGLYRELIGEMQLQVPAMLVQITTEAVGRYSPAEQRDLVRQISPGAVSIALKELSADGAVEENREFYHWALAGSVCVQHIIYTPQELRDLEKWVDKGVVPQSDLQVLFVLGRYSDNLESNPADLGGFLTGLGETGLEADWALCAFGRQETACLEAANRAGGKMRVGFENSFYNSDGTRATGNAERVQEIVARTRR